MAIKPLAINSKELRMMKSVTKADYTEKTILTNSSWEYVSLWLKRQSSEDAKRALFYWSQAKNFFDASECLPIESRPLTAYYCCMNAAKALLSLDGCPALVSNSNLSHGVSSDRRKWGKSNDLKNAEVTFTGSGVLFELSKHLGEQAVKQNYSVYALLYNIPCVHRAFSITFRSTELFIPIRKVGFIIDTDNKKGWAQFQVDERYANGNSLRYVPKQFEKVTYNKDGEYLMRMKKRFDWDIHEKDKCIRHRTLSNYHGVARKYLHYIFGDTHLWYVKKDIPTNNEIINRNSLTLIFAVMHWLSELVRYNPEKFESLMKTKQNWLIHEFVDTALYQYIDEISCEITGTDIMTTGYRK